MWRIFECIYEAFKVDGIDYLEGLLLFPIFLEALAADEQR
jgi:hypothetical protein